MVGIIKVIMIGKYEYLFLYLSIPSLSVPHREVLYSDNCNFSRRFVIESRIVFVAFCLGETTTTLVIAYTMSPVVELYLKFYLFALVSTTFIGVV